MEVYRYYRRGSRCGSGRVKANNIILARQAALAALGIAYLPNYRVVEDIKAGRLVRILAERTTQQREMYAIYPSDRYLSPKVRTFLDFISTRPAYPISI
jgi:DNA-binding transcriptional LysR family regulator